MTTASDRPSRRTLFVCCGAHIIQDGLVALQYVLLPVLAQALGLNYSQVGLLRALSNSAMSLLELPSGLLAERYGEKRLLILGLVMAGLGYLGIAVSSTFGWIALFFLLAGAGAGFQHSLTSAIIVRRFTDAGRRQAMGTYNASGDAGKLGFTALFSLAMGAGIAWDLVITVLSLAAVGFVFLIWKWLPADSPVRQDSGSADIAASLTRRWGIRQPRQFSMLAIVVSLDSIVQSVFLTFLAFVLVEKGASAELAAFAVVLTLCGGMTGKFCCGFLTARFGDHGPFLLIQLLTVFGLAALVFLPVTAILLLLPFVGLVVQGSTTVTYGVIADHVEDTHQSRGFALIYSISGIAMVFGPLLFGLLADLSGLDAVLWSLCALTALSMPLAAFLKQNPALDPGQP